MCNLKQPHKKEAKDMRLSGCERLVGTTNINISIHDLYREFIQEGMTSLLFYSCKRMAEILAKGQARTD